MRRRARHTSETLLAHTQAGRMYTCLSVQKQCRLSIDLFARQRAIVIAVQHVKQLFRRWRFLVRLARRRRRGAIVFFGLLGAAPDSFHAPHEAHFALGQRAAAVGVQFVEQFTRLRGGETGEGTNHNQKTAGQSFTAIGNKD